MQPIYTVTKNCKYRNKPCAKCGFILKLTKKYVLSPDEYVDGFPKVYHVACWTQKQNEHIR